MKERLIMVKTLITQTSEEIPTTLVKKEGAKGSKDAAKSPFAVLMSIVSKSQKKTNDVLDEKEALPSTTINLSPSLVVNVPSLQAKSQVAQTKLSTNISTIAAVTEFKATLMSPKEKEKESTGKSKNGADLAALLSKASDSGLNITKVQWTTTSPQEGASSTLSLAPQPKIKLDDATAKLNTMTATPSAEIKVIKPSNELLTSLLQQPSKSGEQKVTHKETNAKEKEHTLHEKKSVALNDEKTKAEGSNSSQHGSIKTTPDEQQPVVAAPTAQLTQDTTIVMAQNTLSIQQNKTTTKSETPNVKSVDELKHSKESSLQSAQGISTSSVAPKEEKSSSEHHQQKDHHTKQDAPQQPQTQQQNVSPLQNLLAMTQTTSAPTTESNSIQSTSAHHEIQPKQTQTTSHMLEKPETTVAGNSSSSELSGKIVKARETLSTFSTNLSDALSEYKAPMTKLSLSMNPDNLGPVEVTLTQRGNAMQVTVSSPSQALFFMASNAADLKSTLAQTFGDVSMSFNFSQGNSQQQEQNKKHQGWETYQQTLQDNNQNDDAIVDTIEITLPRYF